jgi:hypothetical protein
MGMVVIMVVMIMAMIMVMGMVMLITAFLKLARLEPDPDAAQDSHHQDGHGAKEDP